MTITYHADVIQGSEEWHAMRCGMLTASEMCLVVSPPPKVETRIKKNGDPYKQREWTPFADNDYCRTHLYELLSQRITGYVEPTYIGEAMLRGINDEAEAAAIYAEKYAPVKEVGFVTNDEWGFTIGYSPDRLIGDDGLLECKSRKGKYQIETILTGEVPPEHILQCQTGLLVSGRQWLDFVSYCGGLPMITIRVYPDPVVQAAIVNAATEFENRLAEKMMAYRGVLESGARLVPTERKIVQEMFV